MLFPQAARRRAGGGAQRSLTVIATVAWAHQAAAQATEGTTPNTAIQLPTLAVGGALESGRGPVPDYVAARSAAGTKTDAPLIETPEAISVVTRAQMDAQNAQTINEAVRYTSGVRGEFGGADLRFDGNITIRGFQVDQYLDELRLFRGSFTAPAVDPWLLERIEVVHGPGSVLYGNASPGGFLNLVSKLPVSDPLHIVQFQTGSFGRAQGAVDFGGPLNEDGSLLYRIAGIGRHTETQVKFTAYERVALAPSIAWKPDSNTTVTLLGALLHDPQGGFYNQLPLQGSARPNPRGQIPIDFYQGDPNFDQFLRTQETIGYIAEHRFSDNLSVRQNFRYLHQDIDYRGTYGVSVQSNFTTLNRDVFINNEHQDAIGLDNQALARLTTGPLQHNVLFGLGYQFADYNQFYRESPTTAINFLSPNYFPIVALAAVPPILRRTEYTQNQTGLYVQDQIGFDRLSLTIGGRQDWLDVANRNGFTNVTTATNDSAQSWRAGLIYNFDFGLAPYYSYATSFQPTAGVSFSGAAFKPTEGEQHEIGIKYQPPGSRSLFTAAFFDLTQSNVLTADPAHANFSIQTGEVRSQGVELEGKFSLTDGLKVIASYGYLNDVVTKANGPTQGHHLNGIPAQAMAAWAEYAFQPPVRAEADRRHWALIPSAIFALPRYGVYSVRLLPHDDDGESGLGPTRLFIDDQDGHVVATDIPGAGTAGDVFIQAQFPLHSGRLAGIYGRVAIAVTGLVVAMLSVTGVLIWWRKRRRLARS
jgi:iron complex outermembrane receptor protein